VHGEKRRQKNVDPRHQPALSVRVHPRGPRLPAHQQVAVGHRALEVGDHDGEVGPPVHGDDRRRRALVRGQIVHQHVDGGIPRPLEGRLAGEDRHVPEKIPDE